MRQGQELLLLVGEGIVLRHGSASSDSSARKSSETPTARARRNAFSRPGRDFPARIRENLGVADPRNFRETLAIQTASNHLCEEFLFELHVDKYSMLSECETSRKSRNRKISVKTPCDLASMRDFSTPNSLLGAPFPGNVTRQCKTSGR